MPVQQVVVASVQMSSSLVAAFEGKTPSEMVQELLYDMLDELVERNASDLMRLIRGCAGEQS